MRYVVGVDTRERSRGAIEFASWLAQHSSAGSDTDLVAVQIIDQRARVSMRDDLVDDALADAEQRLVTALQRSDARPGFASARAVLADRPETGLADAVAKFHGDALVVGRIAPSTGAKLARLGQVATRVVRTVGRPIIVVPPDLTHDTVDGRCMLLATDLRDDSIAAAKFARRLATELGLDLVVVHVAPKWHNGFDSEQSALHLRSEAPPAAEVQRWMAEHAGGPARVRLLEGGIVDSLLAVMHDERAAILVTGARRLSRLEHLFTSSVGTDLARLSDRAVAIVPNV